MKKNDSSDFSFGQAVVVTRTLIQSEVDILLWLSIGMS
jgi:hypothetical protein